MTDFNLCILFLSEIITKIPLSSIKGPILKSRILFHTEYSKDMSRIVFFEEVLPKLNHNEECERQLKTEAIGIRAWEVL